MLATYKTTVATVGVNLAWLYTVSFGNGTKNKIHYEQFQMQLDINFLTHQRNIKQHGKNHQWLDLIAFPCSLKNLAEE